MAIAATGEYDCVKKCFSSQECVASVYATSIKPLNCIFVNETFDPINLLHSGETTWQTYLVANDYRGSNCLQQRSRNVRYGIIDMNLTTISCTEFLWQSHGDYSGKLLKIFNLSSLTDCATNCANSPNCTAFKFTNSTLSHRGNTCELHANWHDKRTGNVSIFIRLSFPYEGKTLNTKYLA